MLKANKKRPRSDSEVSAVSSEHDDQEASDSSGSIDAFAIRLESIRKESDEQMADRLVLDLREQQDKKYKKAEAEARAKLDVAAQKTEKCFSSTSRTIESARLQAEKLFAESDIDKIDTQRIASAAALQCQSNDLVAQTKTADAVEVLDAVLKMEERGAQRNTTTTQWRRKLIRGNDQLYQQAESRFEDYVATDRRVAAMRELVWPHSGKDEKVIKSK